MRSPCLLQLLTGVVCFCESWLYEKAHALAGRTSSTVNYAFSLTLFFFLSFQLWMPRHQKHRHLLQPSGTEMVKVIHTYTSCDVFGKTCFNEITAG